MLQMPFDEYKEKRRMTAQGHSQEFQINDCQSQIQIDIPLQEFKTVRVWGQVKDRAGRAVEGILLQLVRVEHGKGAECKFHGLAHAISDCHGFYQFDLCANSLDVCYQIFANKNAVGPEWYIPSEQPYEEIMEKHDEEHPCNCDTPPASTREYENEERHPRYYSTIEAPFLDNNMYGIA